MIHRGLDANNDWKFGRGRQDYSRELEAVKLNIKTRLKSWQGDCFFALTAGVDWNNLLDVGTKDLLDIDIKRVINQSEGVVKINSYRSEIERSDRTIQVESTITTVYGTIDFNEVL